MSKGSSAFCVLHVSHLFRCRVGSPLASEDLIKLNQALSDDARLLPMAVTIGRSRNGAKRLAGLTLREPLS